MNILALVAGKTLDVLEVPPGEERRLVVEFFMAPDVRKLEDLNSRLTTLRVDYDPEQDALGITKVGQDVTGE